MAAIAKSVKAGRSRRGVRRTGEDWAVDIFVYSGAALIFIATFYPFFLSIVLALNEGKDAARGGIYFYPRAFTLENFKMFLIDPKWILSLQITIGRTLLGTALTTLFTAFAAYGLSDRALVGRKLYLSMIIIAMYFSGGVIPYYALLRSVRLINTFWVYVIPGMMSIFYCLVSISFFQSIPHEVPESARIDGAGELRIFARIALPLGAPGIASLFILSFLDNWNLIEQPMTFLRVESEQPLSLFLRRIGEGNVDVAMAASILTLLPTLLLFFYCESYLVEGIQLSGLKE